MLSPSREEILEKVCMLAAEQAVVSRAEVGPESHFVRDLNYDSLAQVEFIIELEDAFGISVPDEQAETVKTVGDAIELIVAFTSGAPQSA
jgi:acyl carrier protein